MSSRFMDKAISVATMAIAILALYALAGPGGPIYQRVASWRQHRQTAAFLRSHWDSLTTSAPSLPDTHRPVTIVEFTDYECPFCRAVAPRLRSLMANDTSVRIVIRNYPLSFHPDARNAAIAAVCALQQNTFAAYSERLLTTDDWHSANDFVRLASDVAVPDTSRFRVCLNSPQAAQRVDADIALGDALGISATPAFVTPAGVQYGALPTSSLRALVRNHPAARP